MLMHIQELETIRRQGIRMLISVMNDGGYGAEFHKFRANGIDPAEAMHGRGDLAGVATGFGLRGAAVTEMGRFAPLFREHQAANIGTVWDIHTDDLIPSRAYRRVHYGEA
jgi:thiamine pyrophosphate-dependent acetolactate synthase large subunit-like protein